MKRDPDTTNNLPSDDKNCNSNIYSPSDIKAAVNFGWQAVRDDKQYSEPNKAFELPFPKLTAYCRIESSQGQEDGRIPS